MEIRGLKKEEYEIFKNGIQESFQKGFEDYFGHCDAIIIPDKDILMSYEAEGAVSYVAVENGEIVGGCIVKINKETQVNDLFILYVKVGVQSKGIGYSIWSEMEKRYPDTKVWRTCTPYFDQRNIHFYVNKCGFHIVEFINKYHCGGQADEEFIGDGGEGMFEFEKKMAQ